MLLSNPSITQSVVRDLTRPQPCSKPFKDHPFALRYKTLPPYQTFKALQTLTSACLRSFPVFHWLWPFFLLLLDFPCVLVLACNAIPHHPHPCSILTLHVTGCTSDLSQLRLNFSFLKGSLPGISFALRSTPCLPSLPCSSRAVLWCLSSWGLSSVRVSPCRACWYTQRLWCSSVECAGAPPQGPAPWGETQGLGSMCWWSGRGAGWVHLPCGGFSRYRLLKLCAVIPAFFFVAFICNHTVLHLACAC